MTAPAWRPLPRPDRGASERPVALPRVPGWPGEQPAAFPGPRSRRVQQPAVLPAPPGWPGERPAAFPGARRGSAEQSRADPRGAIVPFRASRVRVAAPDGVNRALPLVAVLFTALVAQVVLSPRLASADLLLLSTASVAAARGRETGAAYGFAAGLAADLFLATPFGLSALAYTVTGHLLGAPAGARCPSPARRAARLGGLAALGVGLFLVSAGALIGGAGSLPPSTVALRVLAGSAVSAALAPPLFAAVRRLPAASWEHAST